MASDRLYIEKGCCSKRLQMRIVGCRPFLFCMCFPLFFPSARLLCFFPRSSPVCLHCLNLCFPSFLGLPIAWFTGFSFASFAFSFTNLFVSLDMSLSVLLRLFPSLSVPFLSCPFHFPFGQMPEMLEFRARWLQRTESMNTTTLHAWRADHSDHPQALLWTLERCLVMSHLLFPFCLPALHLFLSSLRFALALSDHFLSLFDLTSKLIAETSPRSCLEFPTKATQFDHVLLASSTKFIAGIALSRPLV